VRRLIVSQSWQEPVSFGGQGDVDVQEAGFTAEATVRLHPTYRRLESEIATADGNCKNNGVLEFFPCHENNTTQRPA
jgi:hypothetical protein